MFLDYSSLPFFSLPFHPWSSSFFTSQPSLPLKNSLAKNHADPLHHYQVTQLSVVFVFLLVLKVQSTSTARKGRRILEDQAPVTATKMRSVHCTRAGRRRFLHSENASVFIESPSEQTSPVSVKIQSGKRRRDVNHVNPNCLEKNLL